ncbi:MAG: transcriptional regulator [Bacilli bacterium]|nr:transcriptional regulator [Bacilli bacterium]
MKQYTNDTSTFVKGKGQICESEVIMRKIRLKWIFISLGIALIGYIGFYTYSVYSALDHFNKSGKESIFNNVEKNNLQATEIAPPKWEGKQRVNILLLGGDSRGLKKNDEVPRSDSMMVISIEPNTKKAFLFSILRDTYVKIPGYGQNRINAALALGGPTLAMKTVSNMMGIPIQYYVYTDFKGFIGVIDAVDGVNIDVEKDMNYTDGEDDHIYDIHLKKGYQHMDGKTALEYVRFRHDALSDFARADRQRKFLTAVSEKMQSVTSLFKLPQILNAIDPFIETNISVSEMVKLGSLGYESKASGFNGQQIPPDNLLVEQSINGADVITSDPVKLKKYINDLIIVSLSSNPSPTATATAKPTETTKPKATVKPTTKPIKQAESAAPTITKAPAESTIPVESIQPTESAAPVESVKPLETNTPAESILPVITVMPTDAVTP